MQTKSCTKCSASFSITYKDLEFYKKISPKFGGEVFEIPSPTFCPECRQQRRLSFRNERSLYKRKSDLSGKNIISMYSPESKCPVYSQDEWWSDEWDCLDYRVDFDLNKWFFQQFWKLIQKVPHIAINLVNGENSDFSNFSQDIKNCYLCTRTAWSENIYYSYLAFNQSENCFDCFNIDKCQECYELIDSKNCFKVIKSNHCNNCTDCAFCVNCQDCTHCFGSANLINKKFVLFNEELSEGEYFKRLKKENLSDYNIFMNNIAYIQKHSLDFPVKSHQNINCENCLGNNISNSKNILYGFDCNEIDSGKFLNGAIYGENQYDTDFNYYGDNTFELVSCGKANTVLYSFSAHNSSKVYYSYNIKNCNNVFWCVNLKNKQYCILNKQYTKEEYNTLVPKIIKKMKADWEWWEFFPSSISPFWYNETVAQEYFPINSPLQRGARGGRF